MKSSFIILLLSCSLLSYAQEKDDVGTYNDKAAKSFFESLTPGVLKSGDTLKFSAEVMKIISDDDYRKSIYKDNYTFIDLKQSLEEENHLKAFWYMINLYKNHDIQILQYISSYNKVLKMEELLYSSLYTYAIMDPRITSIKDDKIEVYRPDIFEEYMSITNEIIFRVQNQKVAPKD